MLDINQTKKFLTVTAGILVFSLIGAQSWVSETLGYDLKTDFLDRNERFIEVFSETTECTSPYTMDALLDDLSILSVQLTVHEQREGVIMSDPIQGLIIELHGAYGRDLCTDFSDLSLEQQLLYIEIEHLILDLRGLEKKALHIKKNQKDAIGMLL